MSFLTILKLFGSGFIQRTLANELKHHVTDNDYAALEVALKTAVDGCVAKDPNAVAQGLTDALFNIK